MGLHVRYGKLCESSIRDNYAGLQLFCAFVYAETRAVLKYNFGGF